MKVKEGEGVIVYVTDSQGKPTLIYPRSGGDETIGQRIVAAINGEALDALPQTERVLVTKLRGRRLPDVREIACAWQDYDGTWFAEAEGVSHDIHPDEDGMVEVLTEDAS